MTTPSARTGAKCTSVSCTPGKAAAFGDFNTQERKAAHYLLRAILLSQGYYKALAIMERVEGLAEDSRCANAAVAPVASPLTSPSLIMR